MNHGSIVEVLQAVRVPEFWARFDRRVEVDELTGCHI